jgi:soluble lytic murein transglycosylase-like protein
MKPTFRLLLALGLYLGAQATAAWALTYPATPQEACKQYLALSKTLNAEPQPAPELLACADATLRGKVVELCGALQSSMRCTTPEGATCYVFLLQTDTGVSVALSCSEALDGLRLNDPVRVLASLPADSDGPEFKLYGIVRQADYAPETSPPAAAAAPGPALIAPPSNPRVCVDPPPPTTPKTAVWDGLSPDSRSCPDLPDVNLSQEEINRWKAWVAKHNDNLTDLQLELTVRWVIAYSALAGIDHHLSFAMIAAESDFHPMCLSSAGAMGMTQLMPCNLDDMKVSNPWNVQQNLRGGIQLLSDELHKFVDHPNYEQCILGLAAYNAGAGAVKKYGGVPPYAETQNYVKKVSQQFYDLVQAGYP